MSKLCAKCDKIVYPTEEVKCLDKVCSGGLRWSTITLTTVKIHVNYVGNFGVY